MRKMTEPDYTKFLEELTELSKKHGIEIYGCGCCGSPSLSPLGNKNGHYEYSDRYPSDNLAWIEDAPSQ